MITQPLAPVVQLVAYVKANALPRRNSRGGHNAAENRPAPRNTTLTRQRLKVKLRAC